MNRFATFAVLVVAAFALAQSSPVQDSLSDERDTQAALTVSDDVETAEVNAKGLHVFADYCINSRDSVYSDVKSKADSAASRVFSWFFSMTEDIVQEALNTNKDATSRLTKQLADPSAQVEGDDEVAVTQRALADQRQPQALVTAFQSAFAVTAQAFVNVASQKFAKLSSMPDINNAVQFGDDACAQVEEYETMMRLDFNKYVKAMPEAAKAKFDFVKFDTLPCVTTRRISRVNGICRFFKVAVEPIKKALGY